MKHRAVLLEYLSNPDNKIPKRCEYYKVLGLANLEAAYAVFTPQEMTAIEHDALQIRRKSYGGKLSQVDMAMIQRAIEGDSAAAKLVYQRLEGMGDKPGEGLITMVVLNQLLAMFPADVAQQIREGLVEKCKAIDV